MSDKVITLTLSDSLYEKTQHLIDQGFFVDFDEIMRAGLHRVLLEAALIEGQLETELVSSNQYGFYLQKIRQEISRLGGFFPNKSSDEVIESLRQTRDEVFEEKYAAHFRHQ